ncbi:Transposase DDE domain-containing protein, partial [Pseudomonas sp. NFIX28]
MNVNANLDIGIYRNQHLVENVFAQLKHYRALASRLDKIKRNYESVVAMTFLYEISRNQLDQMLKRLHIKLNEQGLIDLETWMIDSTAVRA